MLTIKIEKVPCVEENLLFKPHSDVINDLCKPQTAFTNIK